MLALVFVYPGRHRHVLSSGKMDATVVCSQMVNGWHPGGKKYDPFGWEVYAIPFGTQSHSVSMHRFPPPSVGKHVSELPKHVSAFGDNSAHGTADVFPAGTQER